ncbi:MAG: DUF3574 domain-containing protein [Chitinophagaceae bacterium]|nr:DUF3574 domain-containing protein [Chitinophagaceae bacterium]
MARITAGIICILLGCSCSMQRYTQTNLYFGRSIPGDTAMVNNTQWQQFVNDRVVPVFSRGFTIMESKGFWLDPVSKKMVTEPSNMVSCISKMTPSLSARIDSICYWYKTLFKQQAVLRIDEKVRAAFL